MSFIISYQPSAISLQLSAKPACPVCPVCPVYRQAGDRQTTGRNLFADS
ncbi:MAG: hypothetical protein V2A64_05480 [Candidatus Omnitrophota bacterium]